MEEVEEEVEEEVGEGISSSLSGISAAASVVVFPVVLTQRLQLFEKGTVSLQRNPAPHTQRRSEDGLQASNTSRWDAAEQSP